MQEISLLLGITVGRVSQLHSSAIVRLVECAKAARLKQTITYWF